MEALFGILGTLLGSFIAWLTSDKHAKMQTTLELHREFNSGEVDVTAEVLTGEF